MIYLVSARWYRSASLYFLKELFEVNIYTDNYLTESCETCKRRWMQAQKHQNKQQQHFCVEWKGDGNYRNNLCVFKKSLADICTACFQKY